jgi:hypothetical protein
MAVFFLSNSPILGLFVYYNYIWISHALEPLEIDHCIVQGIIHSIYVTLFLRSARIRNSNLYLKKAAYSYAILLVFHSYLWYYILENSILAGFTADFLLSVYWNMHMGTLEKINDHLLTP